MTKKLFTLLICMFTLALSLTSCSEEAFDVDSVNKQTILVFFPWTGDTNSEGLTHFLNANVDSISQGISNKKGLNNTRILLFFSESYNKSTLYDLQYDEVNKKVEKITLKTYEGNTYCSAEGITDLLGEVKQQAEALNYALIIGSHGAGWTYAEDWVKYPYRSVQAKPSDTASLPNSNFSGIQYGTDSNKPATRFFGSVSLMDNALNVATLAEGIKQSGLKMQYILFDACYMGNVETAYELKDVTNYLISSSSEIMAAGLPYKTLWSYLNSATPNYSSIVSTTVNFYKGTSEPYCNLAAIDCRQLDKLASVMKEINTKCSLDSDMTLSSLQPLDGFSPNLFYDLTTYVDSLHPSGYLKDQFNAQMQLTVKAAQSTDYVYTALQSSNNEIEVKNYSGLTISDPSLHSVAIKGREKTGWWKATHEGSVE